MPKISNIEKTPAIVEWFELSGVNGYKTIRLKNPYCVKIVAAENGTGKTTLLNALYALLSLNLSSLAKIDFVRLKLKLRYSEELEYYKAELFPRGTSFKPAQSILELKKLGVNERKLRKDLMHIRNRGLESFSFSESFQSTYYSTPIGKAELVSLYQSATSDYYSSPACESLATTLHEQLGNYEVLYLPTFRRIETELTDFPYNKHDRRNHFGTITDDPDEDDNDQLIWFGMGDVEYKLEYFRDRIKTTTFDSYSTISAQSLETLLHPTTKEPKYILSNDDEFSTQLSLVLARLGHAGGETEARISNLIYTGEINDGEYDGLRSHLHQIISIYATTQAQEQLIEGFVKTINNYWSSSSFDEQGRYEKEFIFDKLQLEVSIRNNYNDMPLNLNNLSSGEKQIVAIFAKLYLQQNKKYIILIDEPELSLAMVWQRMLLKDILESPSCEQLIAITHSPFIFDNELDAYAESLEVTYGAQHE